MPWQTPKTDWTGADGVRDSDLNRIEGNMLHLYNYSMPSDQTIYVSNTGSDANGAGTSASPYATITKALSVLPKNLNGKNVNISIAAGTYDESVVVKDFFCGMLRFTGAGSVVIRNLEVRTCTLSISNIDVSVAGSIGVLVTDNGSLITTGSLNVASSTVGISANNNSSIYVGGNVGFTSSNTGIAAANNARIFVSSISGNGVGTIITSSSGANVAYGSNSAVASTALLATATGGRVTTGSQQGTGGGGIL